MLADDWFRENTVNQHRECNCGEPGTRRGNGEKNGQHEAVFGQLLPSWVFPATLPEVERAPGATVNSVCAMPLSPLAHLTEKRYPRFTGEDRQARGLEFPLPGPWTWERPPEMTHGLELDGTSPPVLVLTRVWGRSWGDILL